MREYEVKASSTLYSLNLFLQDDLGFAPDQKVMFKAYSVDKKVKREYGLFDLGDGSMDEVSLESIQKQGLPYIEYVYDMFGGRSISLEFISKEEFLARRSYPRLVAEKGRNPDQFSDSYDDFEHLMDIGEMEEISE
jgi:hypothetical protein